MIKKISTVALAGLICLPGVAAADSDRVAELEKQMADMTKMFNEQMEAMKAEIAELKKKDEDISKEVAGNTENLEKGATAADWTKKISLGGQVRFRGYNIENVWDFDDDKGSDNRDLFRLKGSLWATFKPTDDVTAKIQITDQTWGEGVTYDQSSLTPDDTAMDNNSNKVFLDNAYININNLLGLPVEATFGRQNLLYGSGFVLFDGQSQFASTSMYFDGVRLRWHITDQMMLDGMYMKDQENNVRNSADDDITLAGVYFTGKGLPIIGQQELYILNRDDEAIGKDIWMYGIRLSDKLANGIDYSLEGAIQKGDATKTLDQDAFGTKLNAGYTFTGVSWKPRIYANYVFLSGDGNPDDGDNEQWDVYYGGWPQFGDLLAWKYLNLGPYNNLSKVYAGYDAYSNVIGEAIYSNLQIMGLGASANITPTISLNVSYSNLTFDETDPGVDDDFGDYYQAFLKYQYTKNLSFSLYGALLDPGKAFTDNPYQADMNDNATEVYWEVDYRF